MKLTNRTFSAIIFIIFFGIIGISMAAGIWQTQAPAEDVVVSEPGEIKGWMTLADVSGYFNIPVKELAKIFELPEDVDSHKPLKEIAADNGTETDYYRDLLTQYLAVDSSTEEVNNESSATEAREALTQGSISDDKIAGSSTDTKLPDSKVPDKKNASVNTPPANTGATNIQTSQGDGSGEEQQIKGRMTLKEVEVATKVPVGYICEKLGIPNDTDQNVPLRDLAQQYGFEVDQVRDIVTKYKQ